MMNDGIVAACARKNDVHFAAMSMQKGRTMMKNKYLTFSYDDGVTQDKRLVKLFNKYHMKCTFNLNSELLGKPGYLRREDMWIGHNKVEPREVAELYKGHEIASHTLTHPHLPELWDEEVIRQVEEDRKNLQKLVGYDIVGLAYPGGGPTHNDHVVDLIRKNTGIRYARTTKSNFSFDVQQDLLRFEPTVNNQKEPEQMMELGEKFIKMETTDKPQIFYIWGHSYEFDYYDTWSQFEEFLKMMSDREDIIYATNREALLERPDIL